MNNRGLSWMGLLVFALMRIGVVFAADPAITVSAKQRYPWNGLVDLKFTITGTSGTKYDTSFTAKDMVGGTNITMATVRKSNGTTVNVAKEQILPGTYNWVWDAAADLPKDWECDRVTVTGTANYSAFAYSVKFNANGGSGTMANESFTYGTAKVLTSNSFTRTGYTFQGWATSASGNKAYNDKQSVSNLTTTAGATVNLYAKWSGIAYSVKFNANGGSGTMANESFTYGTAKALTANSFTRTGYTFQGWATSTGGAKVYNDKQSVSNLTTTAGAVVNLYAKWDHGKVQLWAGGPYWATTNIGAENPEDYGYYFWWGDTVGYKRVNGKWVASDGSASDFRFHSAYGGVPTDGKNLSTLKNLGWIDSADSSGVLVPEHDAAHVHWGGEWRMPTRAELGALADNCTWTGSTLNGVNGFVVSGKGEYASSTIFFPCSGFGYDTSFSSTGFFGGSGGNCWSSSPCDYQYAYLLYFSSNGSGVSNNGVYRCYGLTIRPVQGSGE